MAEEDKHSHILGLGLKKRKFLVLRTIEVEIFVAKEDRDANSCIKNIEIILKSENSQLKFLVIMKSENHIFEVDEDRNALFGSRRRSKHVLGAAEDRISG